MKVLVVLEGQHEQGKRERVGALKHLIRRLGGEGAELTFDKMSNSAVHAVHGKGPKHFKRAVRWLQEAQKRHFDALILLIDDDAKKEERRSNQIADAQSSMLVHLPRAMGVAVRTFDAWMLADEKALTNVLGCNVQRQPDPETIRDPKSACAQLLSGAQNQMAQSEMYAEIARRVSFEILSARCPMGFRPFEKHVRRMFGQET